MKLTSQDSIHMAYALRDYVKNNPMPVNCNNEKLLKISDFLLNIKNLEKSFDLTTRKNK